MIKIHRSKLCEITNLGKLNFFRIKFLKNNSANFNRSIFTVFILLTSLVFAAGLLPPAFATSGTLLWEDAMPPISTESPVLYWYFSGHGGTLKGVWSGGGAPPYVDVTVTSYNGLTVVDSIPLTLVNVAGTSNYYLSPNSYINFVTTAGDDALLKLQVVNGGTVKAVGNADWLLGEVKILNPEFRSIPGYVLGKQPNYNTKLCTSGPDVDNDGVCDSWEPSGGPLSITYNGITYTQSCLYSGSISPCMGSDKKDVFVEIDWLKEHGPDLNALNDIKIAFEPKDIRLHFLVDEEILFHSVDLTGPDANADLTEFTKIKKAQFGTSIERNTGSDTDVKNRLTAKRQVFHYALLTHNYTVPTSPSGRAEIDTGGTNAANDLRTNLGGWAGGVGTRAQQAATLMHELGHNLGLNHGGPAADATNCKPNYLSIMSYTFQFPVADPNRPLSYSTTALGQLNENAAGASLDEVSGITGPYNYDDGTPRKIFYGDPSGVPRQDFVGPNIDYDMDGNPADDTDLAQDINKIPDWGCPADGNTNLTSFDDWSILKFKMINSGAFADGFGRFDEVANAMPERPNYDVYYFIVFIAILAVVVGIVVILLRDSGRLRRILENG